VVFANNRDLDFSNFFNPLNDIDEEVNQSSEITDSAIFGEKADGSVLVTRVIDGDTIVLENEEVVRYIGMDTPENPQKKNVECFANESYEKNKELVGGKRVFLVKDVSERDRYGRLLRYVFIEDPADSSEEIFINDYLVREGYASVVSYPPDVKYQEMFGQAEREARENNRGMWAGCPI